MGRNDQSPVSERTAEADQTSASTWLLAAAGVLLAFLAVRLVALHFNAVDLIQDEAQYWSWSRALAFGYYSKPPLIAWLIWLSTAGCGLSEFCVRLPSPIIHFLTGMIVFAIGARLYDGRVGFWSALVYTTMPGVSFSAGIISTDVPMLLLWAAALYGFIVFLEDNQWWSGALLGLAIGLGMNAKYAMAYFVLCAVIYLAVTPHRRRLLASPRWWLAVAVAVVLITPNLAWNYANGFATLAHTGDNARLSGELFNPVEVVEFLVAQFGVFGPVFFFGLMVVAWRAWREGLREPDRLLFAFAAPVIAWVTVLAFISRANANWAVASYVAASVLVPAVMIRDGSWGWLKGSLALHAGIMAVFAVAVWQADAINFPVARNYLTQWLGWDAVASATRQQLEEARRSGKPYGSILTNDRTMTAELLYYMRDEPTPITTWPNAVRPRHHYQLTRPFLETSPQPVLFVGRGPPRPAISERFRQAEPIATHDLAAGSHGTRRVTFTYLNGLRTNQP